MPEHRRLVPRVDDLEEWQAEAELSGGAPGPEGPAGPTGATGATGAAGPGVYGPDAAGAWVDAFGAASVADQEFSRTTPSTALPTGWVFQDAATGGSATYREELGHGVVTIPSGSNSIDYVSCLVRPVLAGAAWTATGKVRNKSYVGAKPCISTGLCLTDGTKVYGIFWNTNPLVLVSIWSNMDGAYGSNPGTHDIPEAESGIEYWRIIKASASDYTFQYSYDGLVWYTPTGGANLDVGATLTPTHIGFLLRQGAGVSKHAVDWLRIR